MSKLPPLSPFAETIFKERYAYDSKESWEKCADRVAKFVANGDKELYDEFFWAISTRKFMPGGRYLYASGREIPQTTNCLAGETKVLTYDGIKPIKDLVGYQKLLTKEGTRTKWVDSEIRSFGVQKLYKITLFRHKITKEIYATKDHDWLVKLKDQRRDKEIKKVKTDQLLSKKYQLVSGSAPKYKKEASPVGIMHGLWFGDGTKRKLRQDNELVLCGDKQQLIPLFDIGFKTRLDTNIDATIISGGPNYFKELPSLNETFAYLYGWLSGYFAADGCVSKDGVCKLSSTTKENIIHIRDICNLLGIYTYSITKQDRISNLTNKPSRIWNLNLHADSLNKDFFLLAHHKDRFIQRISKKPGKSFDSWTIQNVEESDRTEEVFCAIVPETHNFCLEDHIFTGNCFLLKPEDNRESWGEMLNIAFQALTTGGGVGVEYSALREKGIPLKRFGGTSGGPISLMAMVNEMARYVMAGGKRRSALWAGLSWSHADVEDFIKTKNWETSVRAMKEQNFNYPAILDQTNISVRLDDEFFKSIKKNENTQDLYYRICKSMCKTGEPGFSVDLGKQSKDILRNPCGRFSTPILTPKGIRLLGDITKGDIVWTGKRWANVVKKFNNGIQPVYRFKTPNGVFEGTKEHKILQKGKKVPIGEAENIDICRGELGHKIGLTESYASELIDIMDGLMIGDGSVHKASGGLPYLIVGEKDQDYFNSEISFLLTKHRPGITKGAWEVTTTISSSELPYTYLREIPDRFLYGSPAKIQRFLRGLFTANGNVLTGNRERICLKQTSEKLVRQVQIMLSAIGIQSYITKNKSVKIKHNNGKYESKESYNLNITTDRLRFMELIGFIQKYKNKNLKESSRRKSCSDIYSTEYIGEEEVFDIMVDDPDHTYWTGGLLVSNCCEVVSDSNGDCCNLGSVNFSRIENLDELERVTRIGTKFLYLGTFRGWLPHDTFQQVREKYRRIGLGIMGLHEWCLINDKKYEPSGTLGKWLTIWSKVSEEECKKLSDQMNEPFPKGIRAIAPTGTIGIIAETTTGIEPVFCTAYKRRFLGGDSKWKYQYVIDPTVARLVKEHGIDPSTIEDSVTLSKDVERRISMQAFVQDFVDQAISSTINMPEWGEPGNNNAKKFSETLLRYLPRLRGITVYPDGSRPGQPITPIKYETASKHTDVVYEESDERCSQGVCGI